MHQIRLLSLALSLGLLLVSCGDSGIYGTTGSRTSLPRLNSTFVYDYEQHIIPVKPEDTDTTYRFEMTARVSRDEVTSNKYENCIDVNMLDMNGIDLGTMMYRIGYDINGDLGYIQPQFTNRWTRLPITTRESFRIDSVIGSDFITEIHEKTDYLGTETITVGTEKLVCDKIRYQVDVKQMDNVLGRKGNQHEVWTYWYSKQLGFFVARESEIDNEKLFSIHWKYTTKEKLKSYSIK